MVRNRKTLIYDEVVRGTENSALFSFGDKEVWLPRSMIEVDFTHNLVEVPLWIIEDRGLEAYIEE